MPAKDKYTDPELRDQVKEEIHEGDKGGALGQWSARKAQMMAQEYKRRGGGYNTDKSEKDESQRNLDKWSEEEWQTKDGSGNAKQEDGSQQRYLPKKAWEKMSKEERDETDKKKVEESKEGKQHVENTGKAKQARKDASKEENEEGGLGDNDENADDDDVQEEEHEDDAYEEDDEEDGQEEEDESDQVDEDYEDKDASDENADDSKENEDEKNGKNDSRSRKRKATQNKDSSSKKQKSSSSKSGGNAPEGTVGSKHMPDEEPAPRGSVDRLPKKDQKITWRAMPGFVEGKVVEVLTKEKEVDGKNVKASEKDPRIVMTSNSSGKICVHKPDACYYE